MNRMTGAKPGGGVQTEIVSRPVEQPGFLATRSAAHGGFVRARESRSDLSFSAINLQIDELVLTGFSPRDRFHIADAVERELTRLLTEEGIAGLKKDSVELESLDAGKFRVPHDARAHAIGRHAAQLLYRQLSNQRTNEPE